MELQIGQNVSHYRLVEKIGEGGMGQVFKAWDSRLNRHVAVKALRTDRTADHERRQRFLQEARAASALNHPNIVTVYDIFSEEGADFMVMEFVSGKTLAQEIPKGGLRVSQALKLSIQIASALAMAHEAGIVHRDLKPGNVMVTPSGLVKLLDFGLAKLTQVAIEETVETNTDIGAPLTIQGSVMGTARYMSPEQAEGLVVDARSDIFTFGVVLYEMITGECAFQKATTMSTLAAVIRDQPRAAGEMVKDVPPALDDMIHKCLRKSTKDRPQTIREVHDLIGEVQRSWESSTTSSTLISTPAKQPDAGPPTVAAASPPAAADKNAPVAKNAPVTPAQAAPKPTAKAVTGKKSSKTLVLVGVGVLAVAAIIGAVILLPREAPVEPPPMPVAAAAPELAAPLAAEPEPATATPPGTVTPAPSTVPPPPATPKTQARSKKTSPPATIADQSTPVPAPAAAPATTQQPHAAPPAAASSAPKPTQIPATQPPAPVFMANVADGTRIRIVLDQNVMATAESGEPLTFVAGDDVRVGELLVIAKGAAVKGVIAEGSKKKFLRRSKITMTLHSVEAVDGKQIKLREAQVNKAGGRKPVDVEPGGANPKSPDKAIEAPRGTFYFAFVDGDVLVRAKKNGQ
ncbi:MAG: serine/threonine protein kinase [Acidobacteriia bacterium]|nr:serine/threonine protein kinase [Terriglobia bacterium]